MAWRSRTALFALTEGLGPVVRFPTPLTNENYAARLVVPLLSPARRNRKGQNLRMRGRGRHHVAQLQGAAAVTDEDDPDSLHCTVRLLPNRPTSGNGCATSTLTLRNSHNSEARGADAGGMKNADVAWTAFALVACSSTTYARVAPVEPPGPIQPHGASPLAAPLSSGKGRVVVESFQGHTSALEESAAGVRLVCPSTPCFDDVAPGAHRYWFVPKGGTMNVGRDGVVLSKDGAYPAPVETKILRGPWRDDSRASSARTDRGTSHLPAGTGHRLGALRSGPRDRGSWRGQ